MGKLPQLLCCQRSKKDKRSVSLLIFFYLAIYTWFFSIKSNRCLQQIRVMNQFCFNHYVPLVVLRIMVTILISLGIMGI